MGGSLTGDDRRAIFSNAANGVPMEDIMQAFHLSELEVDQAIALVSKKIREYRFRRRFPPLPCSDMKEIRWNRLALLENLAKLGPQYLESSLILPNIGIQNIDDHRRLAEAAREAGARTTGL